MFIPLRTDRATRRRPVVTEGLIILNLIVYLAAAAGSYFGLFRIEQVLALGEFDPIRFNLPGLVTYQFLHDPGSIWHVAFNMLFLWIFGGAVEDRMGRLGFLAFYLVGGALAALGHGLVSRAPIIGASGAVAAVTGAFLALFPRSRIKVLIFFFIIGVYTIPSLWFIGAYIVIDVLNQIGSVFGASARVAYMAHLAGYAYGFGLSLALLATKIVPRGEWDVFRLLTQARRRRMFRSVSADRVGGSFVSASADTQRQLERRRSAQSESDAASRARESARAEIRRHLAAHELDPALDRYTTLVAEDETPFPAPLQLELANGLYARGDAVPAARAYEIFLRHHVRERDADEVRLLLGLLYARRLDRPERARELLEGLPERLRDAEQQALARTLREELA